MQTFRETFETVEKNIRPLITAMGFALHEISVDDKPESIWVFGRADYGEIIRKFQRVEKKRFISISTAPRRLELDLDFGNSSETFGVRELFELEGQGIFPDRKHDLYEAMHNTEQLQSEFERLINVFVGCGKRFFENDASLWIDLKNQRIINAENIEKQKQLNKAEIAFKNRDWSEVVRLLVNWKEELDKLNLARLKYAKKKLP